MDQGAALSGRAVSGGASEAAGWLPWFAVAALVSMALVATALLLSFRPAANQTPVRFDLVLPDEMRLPDAGGAAISPDGQRIAFGAIVDGRLQLVLRDLASTGLVVLSGTEGGSDPLWSSDSRSVALFATNGQLIQLKRIPARGGPVRVVADAQSWELASIIINATWRGDVILFPTGGSIFRVPAAGGTPTALETLPWKPGQRRTSRCSLPDGNHLLVSVADDAALLLR
jgi:hypothetical protein